MISYTLMLTFGLLIRNYEKRKADVQRFALLQYIQDNFASVTLDQIAEKFHYTPEYTSLQDTNLSVANIANQVGYESIAYFIRTFKKWIHMTPTEYHKKGL